MSKASAIIRIPAGRRTKWAVLVFWLIVVADLVSLPPTNPGLPADLLNFHYDPITCAVAAGWDGAVRKEMRLTASLEDDVFRWRPDDEDGRVTSVVTDLDGPRFNQVWIRAVAAAQGG